MSRSYTYVSKHTTENKCVQIYEVSKREKQFDDIPEIREHEICISKPRILVPRVLCRYSGQEYGSDKSIHIESPKDR